MQKNSDTSASKLDLFLFWEEGKVLVLLNGVQIDDKLSIKDLKIDFYHEVDKNSIFNNVILYNLHSEAECLVTYLNLCESFCDIGFYIIRSRRVP